MKYFLEFRLYHRSFRVPLLTHYGSWSVRDGIIVQLRDQENRVGYGEIAPLPHFGTETLDQALQCCQRLAGTVTPEAIAMIPNTLPTCQFGLESAMESLMDSFMGDRPRNPLWAPSFPSAHLLPTGSAARQAWQQPWQQGTRVFKWKIGVNVTQEYEDLVHLMQILPAGSQLRLDANGGLTWDEANRWLELCDRLSNSPDHAQIECVEQPLPVDQFEALLRLSQQYQTPIALDESVATLEQLQTCYQNGWRGIVVIKAAIAGFPSRLRHLCQTYEIDRIWSSVFETAIARQFIFSHLIDVLPPCDRALGFGVRQWFTESVNEQFDPDPIYPTAFERLWQHL